jgi:hypothetical protein
VRSVFRLAALRGKSIGEVLDESDPIELAHWRVFAKVEPMGDERLDILFARLSSLVHNASMTKVADLKQPSDFLTDFWKTPEQRQAEADRKAALELEAWAAQQNAMLAQRGK